MDAVVGIGMIIIVAFIVMMLFVIPGVPWMLLDATWRTVVFFCIVGYPIFIVGYPLHWIWQKLMWRNHITGAEALSNAKWALVMIPLVGLVLGPFMGVLGILFGVYHK